MHFCMVSPDISFMTRRKKVELVELVDKCLQDMQAISESDEPWCVPLSIFRSFNAPSTLLIPRFLIRVPWSSRWMDSADAECCILPGKRTAGVQLWLMSSPTERFVRDSTCEWFVLTRNMTSTSTYCSLQQQLQLQQQKMKQKQR